MFFKKKDTPTDAAPAPVVPLSAASPAPPAPPAMASIGDMSALTAPTQPAAPAAGSTLHSGPAADTLNDPAKAFLQIVSILMRTPETKALALADLEWLLLPPLNNQQTVVAEARDKDGKAKGPVGVVLWATVSPAVDARLSNDRAAIPHMAPHDWKSGDIAWIITAIGRPEVVRAMLEQILTNAIPAGRVKVRSVTQDGAVVVKEIAR